MSLAAPVSWWLAALLLAAAAAVGYWAYARTAVPLAPGRRVVLTALRATALLLLTVFLLRPVATTAVPERRGVLSVVLDNSRSMQISDADGAADRRIDRAVSFLRDELLPAVGERLEVRVATFDRAVPLDALGTVEPNAARTDLAAALRRAADLGDGRTADGIVVVSDGGDTGGGDLVKAVEGLPPVFAVDVGAAVPGADQEVTALSAASAAVAASVVGLTTEVRRRGDGTRPVTVRLREGGRTLEARQLSPSGDGVPVRTTFEVPQRADTAALYTVEIPLEPDEVVVENNQRSVLVRPPDRPRRVLMIEGAPGFEHSFLKRAWLSDPGLELDAVVRKGRDALGEDTFYVQGAAARTAQLGSGFPATRADMFAYDAVVLANIEGGVFRPEQMATIRDFVADRGGGLLMLGSRSLQSDDLRGSPMERLIPVTLTDRARSVSAGGRDAGRNRLVLTDDGAEHPVMALGHTPGETRRAWEGAPALAGSVSLGVAKPGASVLATIGRRQGGVAPLLAVQRFGRGRSMVFGGEAAWRWKMMMPSESRLYETFWRQAIRWLTVTAPDRVMVAVRAEGSGGGRLEIDAWARDAEFRPASDAAVVAEITEPSGEKRTHTMVLADGRDGRYQGQVEAESDGVYRVDLTASRGEVSLGSATDWVLVGGVDAEFVNPWTNDGVLRRIAAASHGQLLTSQSLVSLPGLIMSQAEPQTLVTRELWHGLWTFLLLVALLTAEWTLRRAWGMR